MKKQYEPLFTPWKIGNCEIKNRIVMTSMGGTSIFGWMEPNHFDKEAANFLLNKAKNNVGLILPGIAPVRSTVMNQWIYENKEMFIELARFMDELHKTGAKMFIQLTAGFGRAMAINDLMIKALVNKKLGHILKPVLDVDYVTASASATPNRWFDKVKSRPLTISEIHEMIYGFAETARLCKLAGVDGVEIHAVHEGYLLDQFTTKYTNYRTDECGGSFENRYRFPVEIVRAIKESCGEDYPVSLRYSVVSKVKGFGKGALPEEKDNYTEVGRDLEEGIKAAKYLQDAGYDMLNCDNGTYDSWYWAHPPAYMPQNTNLEYVAEIKDYVDIPVVCAGRMEADDAAEAIADGKIDAMGVARQFLTDPEWVTKLMEDKEDDIMPCICCHNACFNMSHYKGVGNAQPIGDLLKMATCALNPETMQSQKYKIVKTDQPKKVAIIGAGIGGMETARVLALRGHKPVIYEKGNSTGGVFVEAAALPFKEKDRALLKWYKKQMEDLGIEIQFNREVTAEEIADPKKLGADEVIVATGAKAKQIPVPGFEKGIEAIDYLDGAKVGDKVIIIGGGLTGCEIGLDLIRKGKEIAIVEMKNDLIVSDIISLANTSYLRDFFKWKNTEVYLESTLQEITDDGVLIKGKDGKTIKVDGDSVILSIGYNPDPLAKESDQVHLVGDCKKVGTLKTVIWNAWDVAMAI